MALNRAIRWVAGLTLVLAVAGCGADPGPSSSSDPLCASAKALNASASPAAKAMVDVTLGRPNVMGSGPDLVPCTSTAPAGNVTFSVHNRGTTDHEMIVLRTAAAFDHLPVKDGGDPPAPVKVGADKVDEATSAGETGGENLKPGETRTFTIKDMKPGAYVLVCNLAGHYTSGMRAPFVVLPR